MPEVYSDAPVKFVVQHCDDACIIPVLVNAHANVNPNCGGESGVHDYGTVTMVTIPDQTARRQKFINHRHTVQPNRLLSKLVFARSRPRVFANCHCCRGIIKINKNTPLALVSNNTNNNSNNNNNNNNDNTRCGWRRRKQNKNASNGNVKLLPVISNFIRTITKPSDSEDEWFLQARRTSNLSDKRRFVYLLRAGVFLGRRRKIYFYWRTGLYRICLTINRPWTVFILK